MKSNEKSNNVGLKKILVWPLIMSADILIGCLILPALRGVLGNIPYTLLGIIIGIIFPIASIGLIINLRSFISASEMKDKHITYIYLALSTLCLITLTNNIFGLAKNLFGFPITMLNISLAGILLVSSVLGIIHGIIAYVQQREEASGKNSERNSSSIGYVPGAVIDSFSYSSAPSSDSNNDIERRAIEKEIQKLRDNIERGRRKMEERLRNLRNGSIGADRSGVEAANRSAERDIQIDQRKIEELTRKLNSLR